MDKIRKFKEYCKTIGLGYTLRFVVHNFLGNRIKNRKNLVYFAFHNRQLSVGYKGDIDNWRSYISLRKEYGKYLYELPEYKISETQTKTIWWCWLQGEDNAPDLCKACLKSLRENFPDYEIKVVTNENILNYVHIQDYVLEKFRKGYFSRTHFSDILRTLLLVEHGGIWIDSTVLCTGRNDELLSLPLFVYQDWKFNRDEATVCSSWFISARKGDPILTTVRDLILEYWKRYDFLDNYYLFHLFFHLATEKYKKEWELLPRFSNLPPHYLQFELFDDYNEERFNQIKSASDFHKLTYKDPRMKEGQKGSFYNHIVLGE